MKSTLVFLSALGAASAQGVIDKLAPQGAAPAGCKPSMEGKFEISVMDAGASKRDIAIQKRAACSGDGILVASLSDGTIMDAMSRTGYVASNFQFQFDGPPQAGAIYTSGFSVCGNGSLALGSSTVFHKCQSGSFFNLYDRHWAAQCSPVQIMVMPCGGSASAGASQMGDGQVVGTKVVPTTVVMPLSDGQPQVITTQTMIAMCQIGDGQVQAHTTPCMSMPTHPPVSQFSDGQIQVTAPVSQHSDGQVQVTGTAPVSQHSDGQVQVTPTGSGPMPTGSMTMPPAVSGTRPGGGAGGSSSASMPTTVMTSPRQSGSGSATGSAPPASSTPVQASNAAKGLQMGSAGALVMLLLGAVWFL